MIKGVAIYFLVSVLAVIVVALGFIYFLPDIASRKDVQSWLIEKYGQDGQKIAIESASFSWRGPQRIVHLEYQTASHEAFVSSVEVDASLWEIIYRGWHWRELSFPHRIGITNVTYRNVEQDITVSVEHANLSAANELYRQSLDVEGRVAAKTLVLPFSISGSVFIAEKNVDVELLVPRVATKSLIKFLNATKQQSLIRDLVGPEISLKAGMKGTLQTFDFFANLTSRGIRLITMGNKTNQDISFSVDGHPLTASGALRMADGAITLNQASEAAIKLSSAQLATIQSSVYQNHEFALKGPLIVSAKMTSLVVNKGQLASIDLAGNIRGLSVQQTKEGKILKSHAFEPVNFTVAKKSADDKLAILVATSLASQEKPHFVASVTDQEFAISLEDFPTRIINELINVFGASKVVGDILGEKFDAGFSVKKDRQYGVRVNASHLKTNIAFLNSDNDIRLKDDAVIEVKPTGVIEDYLLVSLNPLISSGVVSERDAKIRLRSKGFRIGKPFTKERIKIDHGTLDLGVVHTLNRGALAQVLKDLKLVDPLEVEDTPITFSEITFSVEDGFVYIEPFTMTVGRKQKIKVKGVTDLNKELSSLKFYVGNRTYLVEGPSSQVAVTQVDRPDQEMRGLSEPNIFQMAEKLMPLVISPRQEREALASEGKWEFKFRLGSTINWNYSDQSINQKSKFFLGGFAQAKLEYRRQRHIVSNHLSLTETFQTHPTRPELIVKAFDLLEFDSIYLYLLRKSIGLFAEFKLMTNILPGFEYLRDDYQYLADNGQPWKKENDVRIKLNDQFFPLIFHENFGAILRPVMDSRFVVENRLGVSVRETIATGQRAINDIDTKAKSITIKDLKNAFELGPFAGTSVSGALLFRRLNYRAGVDVMWPAVNVVADRHETPGFLESINVSTQAALNVSILEWVAIETQANLLRFPNLSKLWQFYTNIFVLLSYTF